MVFWTGGSSGYGHIGPSVGGGKVRSTDSGGSGKVATVAVSWPETYWGLKYAGWAWDVNGVTIPHDTDSGSGSGSGGGGEEEDMPKYSRSTVTKPVTISGGDWKTISWDSVPGGDAVTKGDTAIRIGGHTFAGTLTIRATPAEGTSASATIRTRFLERSKHGDQWQTDESYPAVEHVNTSGSTWAVHPVTQSVKEGRRLVAQVKFPNGGTIEAAEFACLYF
jgi:hypothetical protein